MYFRSICDKFFMCSVIKTHSYVLKYVALKMLRVFIGEKLEFIKLFISTFTVFFVLFVSYL